MNHPSLDPHSNFDALLRLNEQCSVYLKWPEEKLLETKQDVSGWSIGQHLYHLALAHGSIPRLIERLQSGRLGEEGLESMPVMVQMIYDGIILRGRKSPEMTRPKEGLDKALIVRDFSRMAKAVQRIEPMLSDLHTIPRKFPHLYFGPLTALEWLRFMAIHCRHHLGIMREIEYAGIDITD